MTPRHLSKPWTHLSMLIADTIVCPPLVGADRVASLARLRRWPDDRRDLVAERRQLRFAGNAGVAADGAEAEFRAVDRVGAACAAGIEGEEVESAADRPLAGDVRQIVWRGAATLAVHRACRTVVGEAGVLAQFEIAVREAGEERRKACAVGSVE